MHPAAFHPTTRAMSNRLCCRRKHAPSDLFNAYMMSSPAFYNKLGHVMKQQQAILFQLKQQKQRRLQPAWVNKQESNQGLYCARFPSWAVTIVAHDTLTEPKQELTHQPLHACNTDQPPKVSHGTTFAWTTDVDGTQTPSLARPMQA